MTGPPNPADNACVLVYNVPGPAGRPARGHARRYPDVDSALARAAAILAEHPGSEAWVERDHRVVMDAREVARHCRRNR